MSRQTWTVIKQNKNFNVFIYRRSLGVLLFSLGLNCVWGLLLFYFYLQQPPRDYYASNGEAPPIPLKALPEPNMSAQALLEPDPPSETLEKAIPQ